MDTKKIVLKLQNNNKTNNNQTHTHRENTKQQQQKPARMQQMYNSLSLMEFKYMVKTPSIWLRMCSHDS